MKTNMCNRCLNLWIVVLSVASCGFPRLSELTDGGTTGDGRPPSQSLELLFGNIGGPGNADGIGTIARFFGPAGVTVDSAGNISVSDWWNHTIRKITSAGVVSTLLSGTEDTITTGGCWGVSLPTGIAVDTAGNVYVADNQTIRKITAAGVVTIFAGVTGVSGSADGTGAAARFNTPSGVAVDNADNVYVSDRGNRTIRKITTAGVVSTLAGTAGTFGNDDGTGAAASFSFPAGITVDGVGDVYVSDWAAVRKITAAGVVTTLATDYAAFTTFASLTGIAVDGIGNTYVADSAYHTIYKVTATGVVSTLAGAIGEPGSADGLGAAARFYTPAAITIDSMNNIYVADCGNSTIRKIAAGIVTTLAGSATVSDQVGGTGYASPLGTISSVAGDNAGNVLIPDSDNAGHVVIRKVDTNGNVTTLAGGAPGSVDGTGTAAGFESLGGVAVDSAGNTYVTDGLTLRKVTPDGVVTTLAGTPHMAGSADGVGTAARFNSPSRVAVDSANDVYVIDQNTIRKVTANRVVTTLAGTPGMTGDADGVGSAARFDNLAGIAVDNAGNVYAAEQNSIRKVTAAGVVITLAGVPGMSGRTDGVGGAVRFNYLTSIATDNAGNAYVTDEFTTIRKVTPTGMTTTIAGADGIRGILLGASPRFSFPGALAVIGDSIVVADGNAVLLLRHGVR